MRRAMNPKQFFAELKRRNVYKVAVAYAVVAWLLMQIATQIFPFFEIPNWVVRLVVLLLVLGFPVALILAWAFELTPEGLKRTESLDVRSASSSSQNRTWLYVAAIGAAISIALFFLGRYTAEHRQSAPSELPAKSIAVLPFDNLSRDPDNAYFAEGVQDEILTRLAKVADLKVISRTSTQRFKSAPDNLPQIAKQLGVTNVLEGSVQKSANQVRVNVQLINAITDAHLWAETYDRKLSDIFQVETEVAQRIATSLEAKLTGREQHDIARIATTNADAYDAFLRALAFDDAQSAEDLDRALHLHRRAIEIDPKFALAWAKLGNKESEKYFTYAHTPEQLARAQQAAETALRLQPDLSEAHQAAGLFYYYCLQDFDRALAELSQAHERSPNNANVILSVGLVKRRQGKLDESIEVQRQAANLDPRNLDIWLNLGRSYRGERKFNEARAMFDRGLAVTPGEPMTVATKAETYVAEGNLDTADQLTSQVVVRPLDDPFGRSIAVLGFRRQFDRAIALISADLKQKESSSPSLAAIGHGAIARFKFAAGSADARSLLEQARRELKTIQAQGGGSIRIRETLIEVEASLGNRDAVQRDAEMLLRDTAKDLWQAPFSEEVVARAYAIMGDAGRAIPLLQHALSVTGLEALTPAFLRLDPVWDRIRNDPRFVKLSDQKQP